MVAAPCYSQEQPQGIIKGRVVDAETKAPLAGTNVMVVGTRTGDASDADGIFIIEDMPVGSYSVQFAYIGYELLIRPDVIVRPQRITTVDAELGPAAIPFQEVSVTAGYFSRAQNQPGSVINFSSEEIRRAPGSAGDVSRIISGLPSIAKVNDQTNSLIVRGGSPVENAFFIDNIEVPNINHYPAQGSSGGPIGLVNVDFVRDVDFYAGGFSAAYGDRLSSVLDLAFREGNRDELDGQLDLHFAGFGTVLEGPIGGVRGSWLFSARRSFLDLLVDAIGTGVAPRYSDYQGKLVYDIGSRHKITVLGLLGLDEINRSKADAEEDETFTYGDHQSSEGTVGVNWRALWPERGYSNTAVSYGTTVFEDDTYETKSETLLLENRSREENIQFRNANHFRLNESNQLEFGIEAKHLIVDYDNFYAEYTDALGDTTPEFAVDRRTRADKVGAYASYTRRLLERLTLTLGARADYFSYNENLYVSPRVSCAYALSERTSLDAAYGTYYQNLPLILLLQKDGYKNLNDPAADHYVLGISRLLGEFTRLTIELYRKDYRNFPLDPMQPALFVLDELFYRYGFFFNHEQLVDTGKAYSHGIEVVLQKKLAREFYGLASATVFRTRYEDHRGSWRDRVFDNRYMVAVEGGYKPSEKWEFSLRWIYAGGPPYTPFDPEASRAINRAVLDGDRINSDRYPDYHSLNVRFDRRFHFHRSNLIFYFSIWNTYGRKNVAAYFWNEMENKQDTVYQWGFLPVFGLEYEF